MSDDREAYDRPGIGVFDPDEELILKPAPNGGWVIYQGDKDPGVRPEMIGAYSSADDMIDALSSALIWDATT